MFNLNLDTKGIGNVVKDIRQAIVNDIPADKKAEIELKLLEIEQNIINNQSDINKKEAENSNFFISGWRPSTAWLCFFAFGLHYIIFPIAKVVQPEIDIPKFDMDQLMYLLIGMLGLGTMRTYEKYKGVNNKH